VHRAAQLVDRALHRATVVLTKIEQQLRVVAARRQRELASDQHDLATLAAAGAGGRARALRLVDDGCESARYLLGAVLAIRRRLGEQALDELRQADRNVRLDFVQ
jgi:hypothetical protein